MTSTIARRAHSARGSWVRAEIGVLEAIGRQLRVDLRRREVGVPEHLLQRAQVAAAGEQVRRERVTQRVRAHLLLQADPSRVTLNDLVETLAREARAAVIDEQARLRTGA